MRLHVPERALTTWIVLDVSPSMAFGTARRLKADVAEGVALVFGRLGVRRAGSVGLVAFGADAPRVLPPRGSKPGMVALRRMLAEGVAPDGQHDPEGLAGALRRAARLARQPGLVVVISDFREQHGWERPLGSLRVRHSVLAVEIVDPRESELPAVGQLALVDPETGARVEVDTSSGRVRERFAELERERRESGRARAAPPARRPRRAVDRRGLAASARPPPAMSFASPLWLLAPVLVPLAMLAASARAPAGSALRRPLPGRVDAARSPSSPGSSWRRHLPAALRARRDRGARGRAGAAARRATAPRSARPR